jgi:phage terminase small subunit
VPETKPLTAKQKRFVEEYLIDLNAAAAAVRAGYSEKASSVEGCRLMKKPQIAAAVKAAQDARAGRTEINQDFVLKGLKAEAEGSGDDSSSSARIRAFELLGKHLGMFVDRHEHAGPNGGPIPFKQIERVIVDPAKAPDPNGARVRAAAGAGPV